MSIRQMHGAKVARTTFAKAALAFVASIALADCNDSAGSVGNAGTSGGPGVGGNGVPIVLPDAAVGTGGAAGTPPTSDANCGMQTSNTTREPADVLLVLDRSGSMNESIAADCCCTSTCRQLISIKQCPDTSACTERWPALMSAVNTTITKTSGIGWGLKLFSSPRGFDSCFVSSGVDVGISDGSAAVATAIAGANPLNSTPTAKAVTAATAYLQALKDQHAKVMLLATDGEPNCRPGSLDPSAPDVDGTLTALQAAVAAGIRVYVIGIGPSVGNLDNFAKAGGTEHYFPATSAAELAEALGAISRVVSSCTFTLSQLPPDPSNVAVYLDGKLVAKDPTNGWAFGAGNQTVMLNGGACTAISAGAGGKVQVLFGCPNQAPPDVLK